MTALERFKELLKTATPEARELVEAYVQAVLAWDLRDETNPKRLLIETPQAAEPVSAQGSVSLIQGLYPHVALPRTFKLGDRVRITKIEEAK